MTRFHMRLPENPRFTTVIANRMWKRVMGVGLIEPVDSMTEDTEASNPALMQHLEKVMQEAGYDLKAFLRVVLNTQVYQREATVADLGNDETYHFPGPMMRRLSAEQVWDSLLTLAVPDVDGGIRVMSDRARGIYDLYDRMMSLSPEELAQQIDEIAMADEPRQAFRRMNRAGNRELEAKARPLYRQLRRAYRDENEKEIERLVNELKQLGLDPESRRRRRRGERGLARASELPSPAPAGHLLRQLGQSDKEEIEGSHADATVPQVLTLLNGFVDETLLKNANAPVMKAALGKARDGEAITSVYLAVLARKPSSSEMAMWKKDFRRDADTALDDLVWTLTNSHEFRFVR